MPIDTITSTEETKLIPNEIQPENKPRTTPCTSMNTWLQDSITNLQDVYQLTFKGSEYLTEDLYQRASTSQDLVTTIHTAPTLLAKHILDKPSYIHVITGTRKSLLPVNEYGDNVNPLITESHAIIKFFSHQMKVLQNALYKNTKNNENEASSAKEKIYDPHARDIFKNVSAILGRDTMTNKVGHQAFYERGQFKANLKSENFPEVIKSCRKFVAEIFENWDEKKSYQDQISYISINIIGNTVLGIPHFDLEDVPDMRIVSEAVVSPIPTKAEVKKANEIMTRLNLKLFNKYKKEMLEADKIIKHELNLTGEETEEEIEARLLKNKPAGGFSGEGNLSSVLMMSLYVLNTNLKERTALEEEIKEYLVNTGKTEEELNADDYKSLKQLDNFFNECLRYTSSVPATARKTSMAVQLTLPNCNNKMKTRIMLDNSLLFFPIRARHYDEKVFENPTKFMSERFNATIDAERAQKSMANLMPFSVGPRSCPAGSGYVQAVFKSFIIKALHYNVSFQKPLAQFSASSLSYKYPEEYYAVIQPKGNESQMDEVNKNRM